MYTVRPPTRVSRSLAEGIKKAACRYTKETGETVDISEVAEGMDVNHALLLSYQVMTLAELHHHYIAKPNIERWQSER